MELQQQGNIWKENFWSMQFKSIIFIVIAYCIEKIVL